MFQRLLERIRQRKKPTFVKVAESVEDKISEQFPDLRWSSRKTSLGVVQTNLIETKHKGTLAGVRPSDQLISINHGKYHNSLVRIVEGVIGKYKTLDEDDYEKNKFKLYTTYRFKLRLK